MSSSAQIHEPGHGHSAACCSIPPVTAVKDYKLKGAYEFIDGVKTYITGPASAATGIFVIMDIFGFFPQTLQGADILATGGEDGYRVFMPDFFDGEPADISWYPPNDETRDQLGEWFGRVANPVKGAEKIPGLLKSLASYAPGITKWAAVGYCWGGKVIALTSGTSTPWTASAQIHPAMLSAAEASSVTIPMVLLASRDEPAEDVAAFKTTLQAAGIKNHIETFGDMIHGWMAARADLEDPSVVKEYERGYKIVLDFFLQNV